MLVRQQDIHDLVCRNTHQAQLCQKLKYDRAKKAKAYKPGDLVWVFCRSPTKRSPQVDARMAYRVAQFLQDILVYILDTGQKVTFSASNHIKVAPLNLPQPPLDTGEIAVIVDAALERSVEPKTDDLSQPSYRSEQLLSEASDVSLPSGRQHWMNTRRRTKLRAGGSRLQYEKYDYSIFDLDDEHSDAMLRIPTYPQDMEHTAMPPDPHPESATQDPVFSRLSGAFIF